MHTWPTSPSLAPMPRRMGAGAVAILTLGLIAPNEAEAQSKPGRLAPKRLSSIGDSITEAVNAEEFNVFDVDSGNPWASYANGYRGFWEWLLGRTNVNSHNQRISRNFGSRNRVNDMQGTSGADSFDLLAQARGAVARQASYVPMLMGHNDVCQGDFSDIPSDAQFEANVRAALEELRLGLPQGATVYIIGIVDIYKLYQLGDDLDAFGFLDCSVLWATTLLDIYPCATMLSPANSEADRLYTRSRNQAFNRILESLAQEYERNDPNHYYAFTDVVSSYTFSASEVSPFDCFHPSAEGQRNLSDITWDAGPFSAYQR